MIFTVGIAIWFCISLEVQVFGHIVQPNTNVTIILDYFGAKREVIHTIKVCVRREKRS